MLPDAGRSALILDRYLRREIAKPFLPILVILIALFASFSAAGFLGDAVGGLMAGDTIARLVGLKVLIALEVLIPVALYISVVLALGRFNSDGEFVAAFALRFTPATVLRAVLALSGVLALVVAGLSLMVRPWAYRELHEISARAEHTLDVSAMRPGTFYVSRDGDRVIFFSRQDRPGSPARDVFVQLWRGDQVRVIHAVQADELTPDTADGSPRIELRDAHVYDIGLGGTAGDRMFSAGEMVVDPADRDATTPAYDAVAASSPSLLHSGFAPDVAELEWRLSTPLSTLLLGVLGIPMSRARPQQSRTARLGGAILIYFAYYLLFTSARTWVQHGAIAAFPGIWWVPALLGLFLVAALGRPARNFELGRA